MSNGGAEEELLQRVRQAIVSAGGVPAVAERTGIPQKTLEKYLSKTSMPSLANAHKIAYAAGITLDALVGEVGSRTAGGRPVKVR
jgi:DNA-binding phage protein